MAVCVPHQHQSHVNRNDGRRRSVAARGRSIGRAKGPKRAGSRSRWHCPFAAPCPPTTATTRHGRSVASPDCNGGGMERPHAAAGAMVMEGTALRRAGDKSVGNEIQRARRVDSDTSLS